MTYTMLFFLILISAALLLHPLAERLRLPFNALLVGAGFIGSEIIVILGFDTGLRWYHFHDIAFYLLLPLTLFRLILTMDLQALFAVWRSVVLLAVPFTLFSAFLIAAVLYWYVAEPCAFPWQSALICGALLASTSPGSAVALLVSRNAPTRLSMLVAGEGLLNSVAMIVLFQLLLSDSLSGNALQFIGNLFLSFVLAFGGGLLIGTGVGMMALAIKRLGSSAEEYMALSLAVCFSGFYIADALLDSAGAAGLLGSGLVWRYGEKTVAASTAKAIEISDHIWRFNGYLASVLLFLLMGITVTGAMFVYHWHTMLVGIAAVLLARFVGVYGLVPIAMSDYQTARQDRAILMWSAMRSVSAIALVLALPEDLDGWWIIQSIAYGVALFSVFVQQLLLQRAVERYAPI